jgi:HK97 family phage major capsid protein
MGQILEKVGAMSNRIQAMDDQIKTASARRDTGAVPVSPGTAPWQNPGAPVARRGENIMGSRGFSFGKTMMMVAGKIPRGEAKIEDEFIGRFQQKMYASGWTPDRQNSMLVPIWPDAFTEEQIDNPMYYEMKSLMAHGVNQNDPQETAFWMKKAAVSPAQSWIDQTLGGSWVPPPTFGPPIDLLRNREALMSLGATTIPLGPSGRIQFPRLTQATTGGWSGENQQQTPTQAKTGLLTLSAKKVISVVALPNELLRFAAPATEAMIRNDIFKTVALIMDKGFLDGEGSDNIPLGLATMGAATNNPYGMYIVTPALANTLSPQDPAKFIGGIMANNGRLTGWLLRPELFYSLAAVRWTPFNAAGQVGGFVFDIVHNIDTPIPERILGKPAVLTPQVSITRGSGTQSYVLGADFEDYLIGMFGAIEFTQTDAGWTLLSSDQTAVRAVLSCDGGPRHPGVFAFLDAVSYTAAGN